MNVALARRRLYNDQSCIERYGVGDIPEWDCFAEISSAFRKCLDDLWGDDTGSSIRDGGQFDFDG